MVSAHRASKLRWRLFIIFVATSVQVGVGIAFGLIAAPLLALIDIAFVPVPVLFLTLFTAVTASWRERGGIHWDQLRYSVSGRLIGSISGAMVLSLIPGDKTFMLIFGLIIASGGDRFGQWVTYSLHAGQYRHCGFCVRFFSRHYQRWRATHGGCLSAPALTGSAADPADVLCLGAFVTLLVLFIGGHLTSRDLALAILLCRPSPWGFGRGQNCVPFLITGFARFFLAVRPLPLPF